MGRKEGVRRTEKEVGRMRMEREEGRGSEEDGEE